MRGAGEVLRDPGGVVTLLPVEVDGVLDAVVFQLSPPGGEVGHVEDGLDEAPVEVDVFCESVPWNGERDARAHPKSLQSMSNSKPSTIQKKECR